MEQWNDGIQIFEIGNPHEEKSEMSECLREDAIVSF